MNNNNNNIKLSNINNKLDNINKKLDLIFEKFERIDKKFENTNSKIDLLRNEFDSKLLRTQKNIISKINKSFVKKFDFNKFKQILQQPIINPINKEITEFKSYEKREFKIQESFCLHTFLKFIINKVKTLIFFIPSENLIPYKIYKINKNNIINKSKSLTDFDGVIFASNNPYFRKYNKYFFNNITLNDTNNFNSELRFNKNFLNYINNIYIIEAKHHITAEKIKSKIIQVINFIKHKNNNFYISKYPLLSLISNNDIFLVFCSSSFKNYNDLKDIISTKIFSITYWQNFKFENLDFDANYTINFIQNHLRNKIYIFDPETKLYYMN